MKMKSEKVFIRDEVWWFVLIKYSMWSSDVLISVKKKKKKKNTRHMLDFVRWCFVSWRKNEWTLEHLSSRSQWWTNETCVWNECTQKRVNHRKYEQRRSDWYVIEHGWISMTHFDQRYVEYVIKGKRKINVIEIDLYVVICTKMRGDVWVYIDG